MDTFTIDEVISKAREEARAEATKMLHERASEAAIVRWGKGATYNLVPVYDKDEEEAFYKEREREAVERLFGALVSLSQRQVIESTFRLSLPE